MRFGPWQYYIPEEEVRPAVVTGFDKVFDGGGSEILFTRRDQKDLETSLSNLMEQLHHVWNRWCLSPTLPFLELGRVKLLPTDSNSTTIIINRNKPNHKGKMVRRCGHINVMNQIEPKFNPFLCNRTKSLSNRTELNRINTTGNTVFLPEAAVVFVVRNGGEKSVINVKDPSIHTITFLLLATSFSEVEDSFINSSLHVILVLRWGHVLLYKPDTFLWYHLEVSNVVKLHVDSPALAVSV